MIEVADGGGVRPSLHHPCIEKQGVEIHRSFNAKATTVDQAPGRLLRRGLVG
jgi:hypothetical protein